MKSFRHRLPALTSLMVFEAAARTMNFTRAAEELHVTQAAVSKQIRYLENYLGFELFKRDGKKVQLTTQGQHLFGKLNASFNYLADAVEDLCSTNDSKTITLAANTAISHYWLNGVIKDFRDQHPDFNINIRLITSDRTSDLFSENVDLAVVYDAEQRIKWTRHLLFEEELYPVASPDYISKKPLLEESLEALASYELLDYERLEPNWINWTLWFEALGLNTRHIKPSSYGNNYITLVDAATRGHGVTLGTRYLLDQELKSGRLTRLSNYIVKSGRSYFLMANNERYLCKEVSQMREWLINYCQKNINS